MLRNVLRRAFSLCLPIHPVLTSSKHPRITNEDIYDAEEALGLVESLGWSISAGPFQGGRFRPTEPIDLEKVRLVDEGHLPTDLEPSEPVNLMGFPAVFQGANWFKVFPNNDQAADNPESEGEEEAKFEAAREYVVKLRYQSKVTYFQKYLLNGLAGFIQQKSIDVIYVDDFLTPLQTRNIQKYLINAMTGVGENAKPKPSKEDPDKPPVVVVDRLGVILEIFNKRSRNDITKLQVALVYLKYAKTLFVREEDCFTTITDITNFSVTRPHELKVQITSAKQTGRRYAMAGEGESQQELQRRITKNLEKVIRGRLESAVAHQTQAIQRTGKRRDVAIVALIGYTNAGKSAVMNLLAEREAVESKDQLFQTLYTVTRKVKIRGNFEVMLVDTIGFISNLPHELVSTFISTLEHLKSADLILHIRDFSHPQSEKQNATVQEVLRVLGFTPEDVQTRVIEVRNKVDKYLARRPGTELADLPDSDGVVHLSATQGLNLETFQKTIVRKIYKMFNCFEHSFRHRFEEHEERALWLRELVKQAGRHP